MTKITGIIITTRYPIEPLPSEEEKLQEELAKIDWDAIKFETKPVIKSGRWHHYYRDYKNERTIHWISGEDNEISSDSIRA